MDNRPTPEAASAAVELLGASLSTRFPHLSVSLTERVEVSYLRDDHSGPPRIVALGEWSRPRAEEKITQVGPHRAWASASRWTAALVDRADPSQPPVCHGLTLYGGRLSVRGGGFKRARKVLRAAVAALGWEGPLEPAPLADHRRVEVWYALEFASGRTSEVRSLDELARQLPGDPLTACMRRSRLVPDAGRTV